MSGSSLPETSLSELAQQVDTEINNEIVNITRGNSILSILGGSFKGWKLKLDDLNNLQPLIIKSFIEKYNIIMFDKNAKINDVAKYIAQNIIKRRATHLYLYLVMQTKIGENKTNLDGFIKKAVQLQTIIKKVNNSNYKETETLPLDLGKLLEDIIGDAGALAKSQEEMNKFWPEAFPLLASEQGGLEDFVKPTASS
jgi:hypothetical protein